MGKYEIYVSAFSREIPAGQLQVILEKQLKEKILVLRFRLLRQRLVGKCPKGSCGGMKPENTFFRSSSVVPWFNHPASCSENGNSGHER
jgi:hypothetical protein